MNFTEYESTGPIVLFLHGFPCNSKLWEQQTTQLKKEFHLVTIDLPGVLNEDMASADEKKLTSIVSSITEYIRGILKRSGKDKVTLVGHDLGCFILNEICMQAPELIERQILINGVGIQAFSSRYSSLRQYLKSWYLLFAASPLSWGVSKGIVQRTIKRMIYSREDQRLMNHVADDSRHSFQTVYLYASLLGAAFKVLISRSVDFCRTPTHLIHGTNDPYLVEPSDKELKVFYRFAKLTKIESGHWLPISDSRFINSIIINGVMGNRVYEA